ncbi:MAG: BlaI/MecI/CopY family transcriptional regulator [Candidatus Latescibacteria bacterium]|nr:BlaI/MecI/CopY family transcriptional regulator [Candidatus Latescibacterota bacterium]NIO57311.1 BlaI/MecI/CopY family transcriptional regulator [Candidatus Latescibacterota bacterium]
MSKKKQLQRLSKRERQIMDVIYTLGEATAADVFKHLPEKVSDASVRKLIRIVEQKGYLTHRRAGHSYIYAPTIPKEIASRQAIKHLLKTFFQDSTPKAVSALLDVSGSELSQEDISELLELIRKAEEEGR